MAFVQVLLIQKICSVLQLLLLLLPPLHAALPCSVTVQEIVVETTLDAENLAEALLCDGAGKFTASWNGDVELSRTISMSNGSTLDVTGTSDSTNDVFISDGAVHMFEVDLGSNVSLTGLTLSGGDGALRVAGGSFVEVTHCSFIQNNRTSSPLEGAVCVSDSNVVFKGETVFENNTAEHGGAIYLDDSSELHFMEGGSVYFVNNHAAGNGGAIRVNDRSVLSSYGIASFVSNEADYGGAINFDDSEGNFVGNVSFEGNNATASGGAIYLDDSSELSFMERGSVSFCSNHAGRSGGAIRVNDDSVFSSYGIASFLSNEAEFGGAVNFDDSEGNFLGNVSFEGNHANDSGGAINFDDSELNFMGNVLFEGNYAKERGGAAYIVGDNITSIGGEIVFANNTAELSGGAIYLGGSNTLNVTEEGNVSFVDNHAGTSGGAIRPYGSSIFDNYGTASFVSNEADNGGAINFEGSEGNFIGNVWFEDNHANTSGGAIYLVGESIIHANGTTSFVGNEATNNGGVASFSSGFILDEEEGIFDPSIITGCRFNGNTATDGGAIYTAAGYDKIVGSSFTRNSAVVQGGALLHSGVLIALTNCTFESNIAGEDGLAIMSLGIVNKISDITFRNNSFFCTSGKYGWEEESDKVEDPDTTCRWDVVCSRCTDPQCDVPTDGIDMDSTTVPVCEEVPEGVNTIGNYSGMTLETLDLMSGYYRTSSQSREILECYREEACLGGSTASSYCARGYAGPYCATCDEGYGSGFQYSCHNCQGSDKWAAIGAAVAVFVVVIFGVALGVAYLVGVVDRPISERSGGWETRISSFRDGLKRAIPLTAIKILLVSWQIITQFSGVVNVQYPPAYEKLLASLSVVNLNLGFILSLSCVVDTNFYTRLFLATITPMAVLGALAITYQIAMLRNGHSIHAKEKARNNHLAVGLFLLFMVYSSVSYTIFQTFVCDLLDSGVTYLRADYDLVCWTKTHVACMTYAGFMILVYPVGIPAVFAWVLYKYRKSIKRVAETTNRTQVPSEAETIKDLWAPYKRSRYYYEVVECGRRIALTGLAVFIYPGSTAQVAIEALLAIVFYSISEILSPFAEPLDAWLYRSGTCVIFLSMYLALLLKMDVANEDSHSQNIFAGLLIAAHVGMILVVVANALMSAMKGFREVRALEMPSRKSGSASTRKNEIEILEGDEDDISKYIPNSLFAERRQTNFAPL